MSSCGCLLGMLTSLWNPAHFSVIPTVPSLQECFCPLSSDGALVLQMRVQDSCRGTVGAASPQILPAGLECSPGFTLSTQHLSLCHLWDVCCLQDSPVLHPLSGKAQSWLPAPHPSTCKGIAQQGKAACRQWGWRIRSLMANFTANKGFGFVLSLLKPVSTCKRQCQQKPAA